MTYTITIPCYRSENFLEDTVHEVVIEMNKIAPYDYEIILINDNSPDETFNVIRKLTKEHSFIKGIDLAKNVGQHNAILAALKEGSGEIFINLDDDLQTHPNQINKLLRKLNEGYDVVYGKFENSTYGKKKQFTSWLHHWVIEWFLDKEEKWVATSFWVAKRFIIQEIIKYSSEYTDMQSNFVRATNSVANQEVEHYERKSGQSGYSLKKSLKLWSSTLNYTEKPALLMVSIGTILALAATIFYLIIGIAYLMGNSSSAGTTNYLISLVLSTLLIIGGFLGIYLSRILKIVENIPSVVIKEKINFTPNENKIQEKTEAIYNFLNKKEEKNEYNENEKNLNTGRW